MYKTHSFKVLLNNLTQVILLLALTRVMRGS